MSVPLQVRTRVRAPHHHAALDGLRGLAIVAVLLFHTDLLPGGFLGVDLFFALSGYLITGLLLREVETTGQISLRAFWGRRIRRLLPAQAAMLLVVTVVVWLVSPADLVRTTLSDGPWVQAHLMNWHLVAESASYWDRFGSARVFEHLWSIAVEEQFYLVWPVVVLVVCRVASRAEASVAAVAALVCLASLVAMIALRDAADPTRVYVGTDTRAFSLLVGAVVATGPIRRALARAVGPHGGAVAAFLAVTVLASWVLVDGKSAPGLFVGGLFAHSMACAVLVALCVGAPTSRPAAVLACEPLRRLGLISYGLYLWHWPVIVLLTQSTGLTSRALTATVILVSTVMAVLSKVLLEDPVRYRARWARGRVGVVAFGAVTVALAALWVVVPGPASVEIDVSQLG